jgi:hypothetical protein
MPENGAINKPRKTVGEQRKIIQFLRRIQESNSIDSLRLKAER